MDGVPDRAFQYKDRDYEGIKEKRCGCGTGRDSVRIGWECRVGEADNERSGTVSSEFDAGEIKKFTQRIKGHGP